MTTRLVMLALLAACDGPPTESDTDTDTDTPPTDTDTDTDTGDVIETVHDPISMPREPLVDPDDFQSAQVCIDCHPTHVDEWSSSMHAYAMVDPVFQRLVELRQTDLDATEDQFCTQCHSSIGTRGGEAVSGFAFADLPPIVMEGITCESCHKISEVVRPFNAGHVLDPEGPMRGTGDGESPFHEVETLEVLGQSEFCGSCHDVFETNGLPLERPYAEWLESPAAAEGRDCHTCHMPERTGPRAVGSPDGTVHDHRFVGVDLPMVEGFIDDETRELLRGRIQALLDTSADLELELFDVVPGEVATAVVSVHNRIDAHNFPTGSTFNRQVWVELVVRADDVPIYETGTLDSLGDLRDHWSTIDPYGDPDLLSLSSRFIDDFGEPTLFTWEAIEHTSSALSPNYSRTWSLFVPVPDDASEVTAEARLRFRPLPPHLLRTLGLVEEADMLPIYDVDTLSLTVPLP